MPARKTTEEEKKSYWTYKKLRQDSTVLHIKSNDISGIQKQERKNF